MNCRICASSDLTLDLHVPNHSKVNLRIVQCKTCGLVQGLCDEDMYSKENDTYKDPNLVLSEISCDSPYSNIRVGKQQMAAKFFNIFDQLPLNLDNIKSVIDVRSARGSFIVNSPQKFPAANVFVGLEQDLYLHPATSSYDSSKISIRDSSIYNYLDHNKTFDFVYSCHTLEHYRDPNKYIKYIKKMMSLNGYFFLDVPALEDFIDDNLLDDFFYDKHLLYFTKQRLLDFLAFHGFDILWSRSSGNGCIEVLAQLNSSIQQRKSTEYNTSSNAIKSSQVSGYSSRLKSNRSNLPQCSQNMNQYISLIDCKVCAFGAGRILDAFKVYGGLNLKSFDYFVDNYLYTASKNINGLAICNFEGLNLSDDALFILFTRKNSSSLRELIKSKYPMSEVLHWSDFLNSDNLPVS